MASYKVGSLRTGLVRLRTGMNRSSAMNFLVGQPGGLTRAVGAFGRLSGFSRSSSSFAHWGENESSWLRRGCRSQQVFEPGCVDAAAGIGRTDSASSEWLTRRANMLGRWRDWGLRPQPIRSQIG